jgi:hypothetical protein
VHLGNVNSLAGGQQNTLYKQYTKARQENFANRDKLWRSHNYDYVYSKSDNPLFSQVSEKRGQRNFVGIDVSSLFSTDGNVLAV